MARWLLPFCLFAFLTLSAAAQTFIDNPDIADRVEAQICENAARLSPVQRRQATGTDDVAPVNVSADDFDEG